MKHTFLLIIITSALGAIEISFNNAVKFEKTGGCIKIIDERDNQETLINPRNIVMVEPSDNNHNDGTTNVYMSGSGTVLHFSQRTNPADDIVRLLSEIGFRYLEAFSDRVSSDKQRYLINVKNIDLIIRGKTNTDRSDTILYYNNGNPDGGRIAINQSVTLYIQLMDKISQNRF